MEVKVLTFVISRERERERDASSQMGEKANLAVQLKLFVSVVNK